MPGMAAAGPGQRRLQPELCRELSWSPPSPFRWRHKIPEPSSGRRRRRSSGTEILDVVWQPGFKQTVTSIKAEPISITERTTAQMNPTKIPMLILFSQRLLVIGALLVKKWTKWYHSEQLLDPRHMGSFDRANSLLGVHQSLSQVEWAAVTLK